MGEQTRKLTLIEKIKLVALVVNLPLIVIYAAIKKVLTRSKTPFKAAVMYTLVGILFKKFYIPPFQKLLLALPHDGLRRLMSRGLPNGFKRYEVPGLPSTSRAIWITEAPNRKRTDPILVYLHGGAYVLPLVMDQYQFVVNLYKQAKNPRLSVLFLDYSLAPQAQYPDQLAEAAQLYHQLVDVEGNTNIRLMGDSCGGNLAIALMAHIHYGHPNSQAVIPINSKIKPTGVVLISPWVDLEPTLTEGSSYQANQHHDYLHWHKDDELSSYYCPSKEYRSGDPFVSPLRAPREFWNDVFPHNTFTVWGDREILRDDCQQFCFNAGLENTHVEQDGVHIAVIFDQNKQTMDKILNVISS